MSTQPLAETNLRKHKKCQIFQLFPLKSLVTTIPQTIVSTNLTLKTCLKHQTPTTKLFHSPRAHINSFPEQRDQNWTYVKVSWRMHQSEFKKRTTTTNPSPHFSQTAGALMILHRKEGENNVGRGGWSERREQRAISGATSGAACMGVEGLWKVLKLVKTKPFFLTKKMIGSKQRVLRSDSTRTTDTTGNVGYLFRTSSRQQVQSLPGSTEERTSL